MGIFAEMADQWIRQNLPEVTPGLCPVEVANPGSRVQLLEDPADWAEDFHRWALSSCCYQDRRFSTIAGMFEDFCEWAAKHSVPCHRETFEKLLRDAGFLIADGWVSGLCLKRWLTAERKRLEPLPLSGVRPS